MTIELEQLQELRNKWLFDPVKAAKDIIGVGVPKPNSDDKVVNLDPLQAEILEDFFELIRAKDKKARFGVDSLNEREKEIYGRIGASIQSGKGTGKTALAAITGLLFLVIFKDARVVILGPKYDQIKANLWPEISKWIGHSIAVYGETSILNQMFSVQSDCIYCNQVSNAELKKRWRMFIQTFPKNSDMEHQKASIQGNHDDNMLFLLDEASGIPDHIFEPIESTLSGPINLVFSIFNPNRNHGWALETQTKMRHKWVASHIDAYKSTLVSDENIEYLRSKYGEDSNKFRVSVLGLPPLAEDGALITFTWIQEAKSRFDKEKINDEDPIIFGVDVGGSGDKSMICIRKGMQVIKLIEKSSENTNAVSGWVTKHILDYNPSYVFVDKNGIGQGVFWNLRTEFGGKKIKGINAQTQAYDNNRFVMKRDELFWRLRESFENDEIAIINDEQLEKELGLLKYEDDNGAGKIKILSKKDASYRQEMMSTVGYKSPNKADALSLTFEVAYSKVYNDTMKNKRKINNRRATGAPKRYSWMGA